MQSNLATQLAALGDPARLAVIGLLRKQPLCSSDLADALSMSRPMMSKHLGILRRSGFVKEAAQELTADARIRLYQLRQEPFTELRGWLDEVEAFWGENLGSFKAHAERTYRKRLR